MINNLNDILKKQKKNEKDILFFPFLSSATLNYFNIRVLKLFFLKFPEPNFDFSYNHFLSFCQYRMSN